MSTRRSLGMLTSLLACACVPADPPERFAISVTASTDEGDPLSGLSVKVDGVPACRTDATGHASIEAIGRRGRAVRISVDTPAEHRALVDGRLVVLDRLTKISGHGPGNGGALEFHARFAPRTRKAVLLVDVGRPGLPVQIFGEQRAVTDENGMAMLVTSGSPGDHVAVRVTNGGQKLRPPQLTRTFTFPDHPDAFVLAGVFGEVPKPPPKRPSRPKRL